ncbi:MAG: hydrogenase maturation nickel metallochaperone HypA [Leptolyngbya sp. RL_3_1]|nr:hydrogenase maturation nickel metallochaperone HypA [Leptolyngbya sp. RL_3_1]
MHEVSLMESTLEIAVRSAQQQGASRIHQLTLRVGQLSGVIPEALEFAFEVVRQGTLADQAKMVIESVPALCHCGHCDRDFQPDDYIYDCPSCHQLCSDLRQGKELELVSLEVS